MSRNTGERLNLLATLLTTTFILILGFVIVEYNPSLFDSYYFFLVPLSVLIPCISLLTLRLRRVSSDTEDFIKKNRNHDIESLSRELNSFAEEVRHLNNDVSDSTNTDEEIINRLSSKYSDWSDRLELLLSIDSSEHLSTEYDTYAKSERTMAIVYDIIAIALSVAGAIIALVSSFNDSTLGAWALVTRATLAVGTFTASGLVFKRGTFHHKEAKAAMRTALTLSQYRDFTANLPDDIKDKIEVEIANRVFSKGEIDHADERIADIFCRRGVTVSELSDLIKLIKSLNVD